MESAVTENILKRRIDEEMKSSYLDYAMSVLVGRALPDVRDGLKPVHRRILYAMHREGLLHNKKHSKCAGVVGEVLKRYHPHGDVAVYDSLVRLAQPWNMRYPLVDGQGNFGSIDGDSAAAYRYTEARLTKIAEELLADIDKETVDFVANYDNTTTEPTCLPSKFPNLLINGSSGIAVGMATNIPPHNVAEVVDAVTAQIDNPDIEVEDLMQHIKGPDFPTGGTICGLDGVRSAYKNGKGLITVRAKMGIESVKERQRIIVTEIPYQINKSQLIEEIVELINDKRIQGISDIRDESDRDGLRIVIELKKDAIADVVVNQLYGHTRLQSTFGVTMIALIKNEPKTLGLRQIINSFIDHRKEVITRRTTFELNKALDKAHIIEGILIALKNIDAVIDLIKKSTDGNSAKLQLIAKFKITEKQSLAILDTRLQRLASLEQQKLKDEFAQLQKEITDLRAILASEQKILQIIKTELEEIKQKYSDPRRTVIEAGSADVQDEDLIPAVETIVTITHNGYIKRLSLDTYKQQKRGGKGIIAAEVAEQDFIEDIFTGNTHDYILFFTDKGIVHWLKIYKIPEASRQAMGKAIVNLLELSDEKISAFIPVKSFDPKYHLILATKKGTIKKTSLSEYSRPRRGGIIAITLEEGDGLIGAELTDGSANLMLATRQGLAARFGEKDVRPTGRSAQGVRGIRLNKDDEVIGMVVEKGTSLLTVTENGYGKRTAFDEYRKIGRGGQGVINIQTSERNSTVAAVKSVEDNHEIMLISKNGIVIRTSVSQIPLIGRNTQGVRIMKLEDKDKLVSVAIIGGSNERIDPDLQRT